MNDAVTIRRLQSAAIDTARAACRTFGWDGALDPGPFLSDSHCHLFVAERGSAVLGWVYGHELIHPDGERTMLLYSLDVVDGARRRGLGRALTEAFVSMRAAAARPRWGSSRRQTTAARRRIGRPAGAATRRSPSCSPDLGPGRHSS